MDKNSWNVIQMILLATFSDIGCGSQPDDTEGRKSVMYNIFFAIMFYLNSTFQNMYCFSCFKNNWQCFLY